MAADTLFRAKAPKIMRRLMDDFDLDVEGAAAVLGNLGHESGGFKFLQEKKPLIPGSRGGYGWAQWTGPRRRQFEAWVAARGLKADSDEANYGFLAYELGGPESAAVPAVKKARGLSAKVRAFELKFERAGMKHYPSRERWAAVALEAFEAAQDRAKTDSPAGVSEAPGGTPAKPPHGQENDEIRQVQQALDRLGYHEVGQIDGKWGGRTAAAIAAFKNDKHLHGEPVIDKDLVRALVAADAEGWRRPIAPARAEATEKTVAKEAPELVPVKRSRLGALWASITSAALAVVSAIADYFQDALTWVVGLKEHAASVPGWAWFVVAAVLAGVMYLLARNGADKIVEAFRRGERA